MKQKQWIVCPFCQRTVMEADFPADDETTQEIEDAVRYHLIDRHPIRRRLFPKFRHAMNYRVPEEQRA